MYHNEEEVGDAIREAGIKREDLFISVYMLALLIVDQSI